MSLLDVNALVALAWPNHIHHETAHLWFAEQQPRGWATCSVTESGFVRVSSNPATTPEARSPAEAIQLLEIMVAQPGHVFWTDDVSLATDELVSRQRLVGHRQVTDAHLLSLAIRHGGRLATFDRGMLQLVPQGREPLDVVDLIE
ncbi:MAG: PIN domain-containing protein [bacterium]|nr:PIN domain-containing protein [bacterium]